MSSGDKNDPYPVDALTANRIIMLPPIARMMRRNPKIDSRNWDIPYLAGYSVDGDKIYIDRDLGLWMYQGRQVSTNRFLILHERIESACIDAIDYSRGNDLAQILTMLKMTAPDDELYFHCHGVATALEEHAVKLAYKEAGLSSYNAFMKTQVKRAEDERIRRVPANLDMTPYEGKDAQDVRLRYVMERPMEAA